MIKRSLIVSMFVVVTSGVFAQVSKPIADIDFVRILNNRSKEAFYYYENNWKVFREVALQRGQIKSFKLLSTQPDSTADYHLILITEYKDSVQYKSKEDAFRPIIKQYAPGGPKLLNDLKPKEFSIVVHRKKAITEFEN